MRAIVTVTATAGVWAICLAPAVLAQSVRNAEVLAPFLHRAINGRADVVMIGDSNQVRGGHGWDHGIGLAYASRFGVFASGLLSAGENLGNGAGAGFEHRSLSTYITDCCQYDGAPPEADRLLSASVEMAPLNYLYLDSGSVGGTINTGMQIDGGAHLDTSSNLRFHIIYSTFLEMGGSFQPSVRMNESPWTELIRADPVPTSDLGYGPRTATIDLPAGERDFPLNLRLTPWGVDMVDPVLIYYMRAENLDASIGASAGSLYAFGGRSARDMAAALQAADNGYLTLYFQNIRALQGLDPIILIRINSGLNDRNEDGSSLGPAAIGDGASPEAFADNLEAILDRVESIWTLNGWDLEELAFLCAVSHPVSDPDDELLVAYRNAANSLSDQRPRLAVLDISWLTTVDEMLASDWYDDNGFDRNHLTIDGFEALAERELEAIWSSICWADQSLNGEVDFADLTIVLGAWGQDYRDRIVGTGMGDVNQDGLVTFADMTSVLGTWGRPCP